MLRSFGILAFSALLSIAGCDDPRCSAANCKTLHDCGLVFQDEPEVPLLCGPAATEDALLSYCEKACETEHAGESLDCIASTFGSSCPQPDGGYPTEDEIASACGGGGPDGGPPCGPNCDACNSKCYMDSYTCNETCPDAGVCLGCEYACSQTTQSCLQSCPTN